MKKIIFLNNWGESPTNIKKRYDSYTPNNCGQWKSICSTDKIEEADFYVVLDGINPEVSNFKIDLNRTLYMVREHSHIVQTNYEPWRESKYFHDFHKEGNYSPITWWVKKSYDQCKNLKFLDIQKNKLCSFILSGKQMCQGHYVRLEFGRKCNKELNCIDYYGQNLQNFYNYFGELGDKSKGIENYLFSVCCENGKTNNELSERLADIFLCWSFPIFWGTPNIKNFFPENSFYYLDIERQDSVRLLEKFLMEKEFGKEEIEAIEYSRNLVLDKYNIWPTVEKIFLDFF